MPIHSSDSTLVGYQQNTTVKGNQGVGVTFLPVSGTGTMADLTVVGYEGEYLDNEIYCTKLDIYGRAITQMFWLDSEAWEEDGEVYPAQYGWWNMDADTEYNATTLSAGESICQVTAPG